MGQDFEMNATAANPQTQTGFLGWVERTGNRLPDPVLLFVYFIAILIALSVVASLAGWSAIHPAEIDPDTGIHRIITVESLLSEENLRRLLTLVPETFTHFPPLGFVLTVMLGAGVAERSGLFTTAMRASVANVSRFWLTPSVALACMMANHAADAAFVVMIPLAAIIYHAAGRHPLVGIAVSFAAVSGAFSANLVPGQLDALLLGITEAAVQTVFGEYTINIAGNWYFIAAMTFAYLPVIWFVTDRVIEPRLGTYDPALAGEAQAQDVPDEITPAQKRGMRNAALVALGLVALWLLLVFGPVAPLVDTSAPPEAQMNPLYESLLPFFLLIFLLPGYAYGRAAGTIGDHRDLISMMAEAMKDMAYYLVLSFVAAHFVVMFAWSNMGIVLAVTGAGALKASGLPMWAMLIAIVLFGAFLNLIIGSASAKWSVLAPVLVPMLMLVGVSPEMTTAAYRVGDSATNIITPLMVYFPLILIFCQRWNRNFGLGSLTALMMPYFFGIMAAGLAVTVSWVIFDIPLGPGTGVFMDVPAASE